MKRVMFVCHGNICRSPMAQFVFLELIRQAGLEGEFEVASSGTSAEELGNPMYPKAASKLGEEGIPITERRAVKLIARDYERYDYLVGMDRTNVRNMLKLFGGDHRQKIVRLLDFTSVPEDIADPWYTNDFDAAYQKIREGCEGLLRLLAE